MSGDPGRHIIHRHARPGAGHPCLHDLAAVKTWMAGTSPAMTSELRSACCVAPGMTLCKRAPHPVLSLESRPVQARKKRLVSMLRPGTFALTTLLAALSATGPLTTDMYLPSLPDIARQLNGSTAQVQFTISAYLIGFAVGQI